MERKFEIDENGFYPEIHEIVKNYLANKKRTPYYIVEVLEDYDEKIDPYETSSFTLPLSEEEVSAFRQLIDKYGETDFVNHLKENPEVADFVSDCDTWSKLISVDLNFKQYKYNYTRHYLTPKGDNAVRSDIIISDKTYTKLLYLGLTDGPLCFNYLREQDEELYNSLNLYIRMDTYNEFSDSRRDHTPFLVTLDEAEEDVKTILSQNPDLKQYLLERYFPEMFIDWSEIVGKDK